MDSMQGQMEEGGRLLDGVPASSNLSTSVTQPPVPSFLNDNPSGDNLSQGIIGSSNIPPRTSILGVGPGQS